MVSALTSPGRGTSIVEPALPGAVGEDRVEMRREPNTRNTREDAEREAEIADAVDDEGLDRRGVGRRRGRTRSRSAGRSTRPTPSQPKNICTKLSAVTSISMKKVNRLQIGHEARDRPGRRPCSRPNRRGPSPTRR